MKLDLSRSRRNSTTSPPSTTAVNSVIGELGEHQKLQPGRWVQLLELPSSLSFDEALLLCQSSDDQWVVWIPEHGEATLRNHQFCPTVGHPFDN